MIYKNKKVKNYLIYASNASLNIKLKDMGEFKMVSDVVLKKLYQPKEIQFPKKEQTIGFEEYKKVLDEMKPETPEENADTKEENADTKDGDGLVPLYSACMGYKLDEMPKELRKKFKVFKGTHPGMLMDLRALDSVCKFLKD